MAKTEKSATVGEKSDPPSAVVIELENVAFGGRSIVYDVLSSVLSDKGVELEPAVFARYCLNRPIEQGVPALLKSGVKSRLSPEKLVPDVTQAVKLSLTDGSRSLEPFAAALLKAAREQDLQIGAVSDSDEETAKQLVEKLGLADEDVQVYVPTTGEPSSVLLEAWASVARNMGVASRRCVAVTTSAEANLAALSAGMCSVAMPDRFTTFQDFGGADLVVDSPDEGTPAEVLRLLADRP